MYSITDKCLRAQLHRQFAIAQYLYNNITDEDKERLLFDPDTGRWSGYKHPYGFKVSLVKRPKADLQLTPKAFP